jgi:hypothetical protein
MGKQRLNLVFGFQSTMLRPFDPDVKSGLRTGSAHFDQTQCRQHKSTFFNQLFILKNPASGKDGILFYLHTSFAIIHNNRGRQNDRALINTRTSC